MAKKITDFDSKADYEKFEAGTREWFLNTYHLGRLFSSPSPQPPALLHIILLLTEILQTIKRIQWFSSDTEEGPDSTGPSSVAPQTKGKK